MPNDFSEERLRELHKIIQNALLTAYPNPERTGCPGTEVLREIASLPNPEQHSQSAHLMRCSPCLWEMLELRGERIDRILKQRKARVCYAVAAALVIVAALVVPVGKKIEREYGNSRIKKAEGRPSGRISEISQTVDLWSWPTARGGNDQAQGRSLSWPAAMMVHLRVILPRGTDSGIYNIAVTRDRAGKDVIASASAPSSALGRNPVKNVVVVTLDLRGATPGMYFLQTTDPTNLSYSYPLRIT